MSILFKGDIKEGEYKLVRTTDGWALDGDIVYVGIEVPYSWVFDDDLIRRSDVLDMLKGSYVHEDGIHYWRDHHNDCIDGLKKNLKFIPSVDIPTIYCTAEEMENMYYTAEEIESIEKASINNLLVSLKDRPQGEWIPATWQDENCPERLKRHKCSECGQRAEQILVRTELVDNYYCNKAEPITEYTHKEQLSKYCPNCGAQMKGADDE